MQQERTRIYPDLEPRDGVLVVDGYGVKVHCLRGRLVVSDGIGPERRTATLHRATSHLKRMVLLGHEGFVTLEAIRWLGDVGAALVHIGRDGRLLSTSATSGRDDPRLRRAQGLAGGSDVGMAIARDLLRSKLEGQAQLLDRLEGSDEARASVTSALSGLERGNNPAELMVVEASAALAYWESWSGVEVPFVRADSVKVPDHWRTFGRRASPLTGNPRLAGNPANALLNYLYAILEAECRIACFAVGLDPGLGVLHTDQPSRDSLALDVMEAVRPEVDGYVLDLLEGHVFRAKDFFETRQGVCRIIAPLTHHLATTAPRWRRAAGPVVERIARTLLALPSKRSIPTPLTEANRSAGREPVRSGPRRVGPTPVRLQSACRTCGAELDDRGRRFCDDCLQEARAEHAATTFAEAGPAALARMREAGADPTQTPQARAKLSESMSRRGIDVAAWDREHGEQPDPEVFRREILPGLQGVPLARIVVRTGLSLRYASLIRRGERVPHAMHWAALRAAAGSGPASAPQTTGGLR